jgi:hypothetical protein
MDKFVREQNLRRYRNLLITMTDEEQRNQIEHLIAEEEAEEAATAATDAITPGVIWA